MNNSASPKIFISYKRIDVKRVFQIKDYIETNVGVSCWIDLDGIESDAQFVGTIMKAIDNASIFLFMYSLAHSKIKEDFETDWTVREINYAQKRKKRIVFINIDKTPLSEYFLFMFPYKQQVDASSKESLQKLCNDIREWLKISSIKKEPISNKKYNKKVVKLLNTKVSFELKKALSWISVKYKTIILLFLCCSILCLLWICLPKISSQFNNNEDPEWYSVLKEDTPEAYIRYIQKKPEGVYLSIAKDSLSSIMLRQQKIALNLGNRVLIDIRNMQENGDYSNLEKSISNAALMFDIYNTIKRNIQYCSDTVNESSISLISTHKDSIMSCVAILKDTLLNDLKWSPDDIKITYIKQLNTIDAFLNQYTIIEQ